MKLGKVLLLTAAVLGTVSSLAVTDVQAKTGYHRTKNTAVKPKAFYSTSKHGATYQANGSLTNFKFKKNHALTHYRDSTWIATSKTYIKMHGKHHLYYYVHNSDGKAQGWVWSGYLKAGKHNQMRQEASKQVGNYVMAKPGKLYQFGGGYRAKHFSPFNIRFKHGIKLSDKVTYKRTQLWTVYKHGKASKYYYVTSSDNQVKGWVWHGFLKPGEVKEAAKKPAPVVTKPNGGSVAVTPNPVSPIQKPVSSAPAWATDDGRRARIAFDIDDLERWLAAGHSYDLGIYAAEHPENGDQHAAYLKSIYYKVDPVNSFYHPKRLYGINKDGKEVRVSIDEPTLANGDIILVSEEDWFSSLNAPDIHTKYLVDGWPQFYVTWTPTWEQYDPIKNTNKSWKFNLDKQEWEREVPIKVDNQKQSMLN